MSLVRSSISRAAVHARYASGTRTVMSPFEGGPMYKQLRESILFFRRGVVRKGQRYVDRNFDLTRAAAYGEPEVSLNYHANYWRYMVDQTYQTGVLGKAYQDLFSWAPAAALGLILGGLHIRWLHNDKYNVFKKWKTIED